jgi:hypothetical protein
MHVIWEEFKNGGWPNLVIVLFGLLGVAVAVLAAALAAARSRAALPAGMASVLLAAFIAAIGLLGVMWGRSRTNEALLGESISPSQKERIQRAGYDESRSCSRFALAFGALPLLFGAAAMAVGVTQRRKAALERAAKPAWGDAATFGPPGAQLTPSPLGPAPGQSASGSGAVGAAVVFGIGALAMIGATVPLFGKLPGRDLPLDDPTWGLLEAQHDITRGDLTEGCRALDQSIGGTRDIYGYGGPSSGRAADRSQVPDFDGLCAKCVDHWIDEAMRASGSDRRIKLEKIKQSKLTINDEQLKRINLESAALTLGMNGLGDIGIGGIGSSEPGTLGNSGSKPTIRMGATSVSGRLPPEVIQRVVRQNFGRFRLCYEKGLEKNPELQGRVSVKFVIGRDGAVTSAANSGSDLPDEAVIACIVKSFNGLSFPQPEGGIVTVSYPIMFTPAAK